MKIFTYSRARQELASVLDRAAREGEARIRRRDGRLFSVRPVRGRRSPLDVPGVSTDVTTGELVRIIREGRRGRPAISGLSNGRLPRSVGARPRSNKQRKRARRG